MLKVNIRKDYLERRRQLTLSEMQDKTAQITEKFGKLDLTEKHQLLSYYPINTQNEFDVVLPETMLRKRSPEIRIAWPKLGIDESTMEAIQLDKETLFVKNRYNILEPLHGEKVQPKLIDILFIPLIAFDIKGYRVGFGKGYYDRYLARCRPDALKIGFSFFEPVDSLDDIHQFDVPLNLCISPMRVYEF
ncbi:MAG: 5-formyltetrahydrofolate cyclo-ligase [Flavitalea sp.]